MVLFVYMVLGWIIWLEMMLLMFNCKIDRK